MPTIVVDKEPFEVDASPDVCPHCHHAVAPVFLVAIWHKSEKVVDAAYRCTRNSCARMFVAVFRQDFMRPHLPYELRGSYPRSPVPPVFSEEIRKLSPQFVEVYAQAAAAETYDLDEVAGVGYRKALEFLIKDYAISKNPDKEEEIKSKFLGKVVDEYIASENIKQCAKRATWLGNDETHYVRKWATKDINDLKLLIDLTEHWIEQELLTESFLKDMPG